MMGKNNNDPIVTISDLTVTTVQAGAATTANYQLESDGDIGRSNPTGTAMNDGGDWITPKAAAGAAYECRATLISGTLTSGTTGSWLALSTTRTWGVNSGSPPGKKVCTFTLEIRRASDGVVLDTATITVDATAEL